MLITLPLSIYIAANVNELNVKIEVFFFSFLPLNAHHLLNGLFDVERCYIFSEFSCFYLGVVQKILDYESHDVR